MMNQQKNYRDMYVYRANWLFSLLLLASLSLWLPGCNLLPQSPHVYRVGIVAPPTYLETVEGFKSGMTEIGYIEGQNIVYEFPEPGSTIDAYQRTTQQLIDNQVDVIFTASNATISVAKIATQETSIPVVFAYGFIEGTNLVASIREPGGNITGVRYPGPELISKRLETLVEIAPQVKRVWIVYQEGSPTTNLTLDALRPAAAATGITLVEVPVTSLEELIADLDARDAAADIGMDAIVLMPDGLNYTPQGLERILTFADDHRIPVAGGFRYAVEAGALLATSSDLVRVGELAAPLVDKVLQGTPAGSIPLVTPEQDLWINYQVAQELGLTVPEGLLRQATEVIR